MNETKIDKIPVKDELPESKKRKKSCDKSEEKAREERFPKRN